MRAFFAQRLAVAPAALTAALLLALAPPARSQEEPPGEGADSSATTAGDDEGADTDQEGADAGAEETAPVEPGPAKPVEPVEPVWPVAPPPPTEPVKPAKADGHKALVRPALWLAWSRSRFRKRNSITEPGDTFELEDDFDTQSFRLLLPVEGLIRAENKEFRFRYLWWNAEGSQTCPTGWKFGSIDLVAPQSVDATLDTDILGADILFRVSQYRYFDLFLTSGADLFMTRLKVDAGAGGIDDIEETIPILTVGLGLRFNVRDNVSVFLSNAALSYSQLLGIKDAFFDVKDTYRNLELSVRWEFDLYPDLTLGAGWRHYEVGFENNDLMASQRMRGLVGWLRYEF